MRKIWPNCYFVFKYLGHYQKCTTKGKNGYYVGDDVFHPLNGLKFLCLSVLNKKLYKIFF